MSQAFYREPCFWTTSNSAQTGYNSPDRERSIVVDGERRRIKHPQVGHQGDYDQPVRSWGEGTRWMRVIKTNGSEVFYVLTAGAADLDPNSQYALERRAKARAFGWFSIGACPVALLRAGQLEPGHFAERGLLDAQPCDPGSYSFRRPCPHVHVEAAARRAKHNAVDAELAASFANKAEQAQRDHTSALVAAQREQTEALIAVLGTALGAKQGDPEPAPPPAPPPAPTGRKRE